LNLRGGGVVSGEAFFCGPLSDFATR
jgi:hypothetical protein